MASEQGNQRDGQGGADAWRVHADLSFGVVIGLLTVAPFGPATTAIQEYRDQLNAVEALQVAQRQEGGYSERATQGVLQGAGKVSKSEAKKRTRRGAVVKENPGLAKKMSRGELSSEQVDLLADASVKTGGDAATDVVLLDQVENSNPDQARKIIKKYVDDHGDSTNKTETRWQRQRRMRKLSRFQTERGTAAIFMEGDDETIDAVMAQIASDADGLYRKDGGRDLTPGEHPRTKEQRLFDAAANRITAARQRPMGTTVAGSRPDTSPEQRSNRTQPTDCSGSKTTPEGSSPATSSESAVQLDADTASSETKTCDCVARNRPTGRPTMVFTANLSDITDDPDLLLEWECELIGTGKVPRAVAEYYRCISDTSAQFLSETGEALWKGRATRNVSPGQWVALVVRDRGCVLCGADHAMCEAHHLTPWNAPAKGETNIDELAMVCIDCHHRIHYNVLTLYQDHKTGQWRLRPARWSETPTSKPHSEHSKKPRAEADKRTQPRDASIEPVPFTKRE